VRVRQTIEGLELRSNILAGVGAGDPKGWLQIKPNE